jgi:hypothetical protein
MRVAGIQPDLDGQVVPMATRSPPGSDGGQTRPFRFQQAETCLFVSARLSVQHTGYGPVIGESRRSGRSNRATGTEEGDNGACVTGASARRSRKR